MAGGLRAGRLNAVAVRAAVLTRTAQKQALIRRLSDAQCTLLIFCDEPPGAGIQPVVAGPQKYLLPPPYDLDRLQARLYAGNWQAIHPPNAAFAPVDTFRLGGAELEAVMQGAGLTLIIDSFHDDIEWNVVEYPRPSGPLTAA